MMETAALFVSWVDLLPFSHVIWLHQKAVCWKSSRENFHFILFFTTGRESRHVGHPRQCVARFDRPVSGAAGPFWLSDLGKDSAHVGWRYCFLLAHVGGMPVDIFLGSNFRR